MEFDDLHIYQQSEEHDDVYLIASRQAAEKLRDMLNRLLEDGHAMERFSTVDGEGYEVLAAIVSDENTIRKMRLPYTDRQDSDFNKEPSEIYNDSIKKMLGVIHV